MNDRLRALIGDEPEHKVVAKKAERAAIDDVCENCDQPYDRGTWVLKVTTGSYENYIHEVCPTVAAAS